MGIDLTEPTIKNNIIGHITTYDPSPTLPEYTTIYDLWYRPDLDEIYGRPHSSVAFKIFPVPYYPSVEWVGVWNGTHRYYSYRTDYLTDSTFIPLSATDPTYPGCGIKTACGSRYWRLGSDVGMASNYIREHEKLSASITTKSVSPSANNTYVYPFGLGFRFGYICDDLGGTTRMWDSVNNVFTTKATPPAVTYSSSSAWSFPAAGVNGLAVVVNLDSADNWIYHELADTFITSIATVAANDHLASLSVKSPSSFLLMNIGTYGSFDGCNPGSEYQVLTKSWSTINFTSSHYTTWYARLSQNMGIACGLFGPWSEASAARRAPQIFNFISSVATTMSNGPYIQAGTTLSYTTGNNGAVSLLG